MDCSGIALFDFYYAACTHWEKFFFSVTAWYVVHMLKLQYHYVSLGKFYKLNMWIVLALLYSKVKAIFAMRPVQEKLVTVWYIIHKLKILPVTSTN